MSEEEDLAVLIYKSSKTAKARAAVAAAKEKGQINDSSTGLRISTRKRSFSNQEDKASMDRPGKKTAASKEHQFPGDSQKVEGQSDSDRRKYVCTTNQCTNNIINGGVCKRHGAKIRLCRSEGCPNQIIRGGVCRRHGAELKLCSSEGCTNIAQKGGVCTRHGAKRRLCKSEGCPNIAQRRGICRRHGAEIKLCSSEGCTNQVTNGGVCTRHGAKRILCRSEGCPNIAQRGGVCKRHGAKVMTRKRKRIESSLC
eukprot:scaffold4110_cov77-Skeletonema_dohrnii-CCMP3373.AAC.13